MRRIEPWLRGIGFVIWAFVGLSRWAPHAAWLGAWLAYGAAFAGASLRPRGLSNTITVALLAAQTVSVVLLAHLGLRGSEGLLCSLVVAEAATALPLRQATGWAIAQVAPLVVAVYPPSSPRSLVEILGAYATFSAFTLLAARLHALAQERGRAIERLRIAGELHDSLGHQLTALRIQLELAARMLGDAPEPIARSQEIAKGAIGELRRVVGAMHATTDLRARLAEIARNIPAPAIHIGEVEPVDDPARAHAFARCAEEAIANAVKHAGARNVRVDLRRAGDALELTVRDDGHGLAGMRRRAAELGGALELRDADGLELKISLPAVRP
jgi:signal transduction histidine kinase